MLYKITRRLDDTYTTSVEDWPVPDDLSWGDWISQSGIQTHTREGLLWDISPNDMPAQIPDAEALQRQLVLMGIRKTHKLDGQPQYESDDEEDSDIISSTDDLGLLDTDVDEELM